jgi:uncharacterized damage-inducible protein DinB
MNSRLYGLAGSLSEDIQRSADGSFFGSLVGTLNHLTFGDLFILTHVRTALGRASPLDSLPQQVEFEPGKQFGSTVAELLPLRNSIDTAVVESSAGFTSDELKQQGAGPVPLWVVLDHYFQHQTHHRGQATASLSQKGLSYPSFADVVGIFQGR